MDQPPAIYDHAFPGSMKLHGGYGGEISAIDGPCFPYIAAACARRVGLECHVWYQDGKLTAELLRHEIGHCNGWPADHPGAKIK